VTAQSREFFDRLDPEVARAILEGARLQVHAARAIITRDDNGHPAVAIDTLPRASRPPRWEKTTRKICRILKAEMDKIPPGTMSALAAVAGIVPDTDMPILEVVTFVSMGDDGGSWWEVVASLGLVAAGLPDLQRTATRVQKKVLAEVCRI